MVEFSNQPAFEDAPKNGTANTAEDATKEENVDVVGKESGARQRVQGAVTQACCLAPISICECANERCGDAGGDESRQE